MSVDTYLKGKDTSAYHRVDHDGVEVFVSPGLARWSGRITLGTKAGWLRRGFDVAAEHEHGPACRH